MNSLERLPALHWLFTMPVAHRGLHDGNRRVPENSMLAFQLAVEHRYAIELDVHLLADGAVAVFHDDRLGRMCRKDVWITDLDRTVLPLYKLAGTPYGIPLLQEVLEMVDDRVPVLIELKSSTKKKALEKAVGQLLKGYRGRVAVQSFNPFSLQWFSIHLPLIPRGQLSGDFRHEKLNWLLKKVLQSMWLNRFSKPSFIGYDARALPAKRVAAYRKSGLPILAWTVRTPEEQQAVADHCDNIIFELFNP